jgi:hypothetical protein
MATPFVGIYASSYSAYTTGTTTTPPAPASPVITSFSPMSGVQGSTMRITGNGFTGATLVSINSATVASFTVDSATQITAVLSNSQATGKVRVTTPAGTAVSTADFTVTTTTTTPPATSLGKAFVYTNGDSIMDGDTLANRGAERWIQQLIPNVSASDFGGFASIAVSGQSTQDMLNRIPTVELPMLNALDPNVYKQIICVFDGGENDMMYGVTAAQVRANRTAYMSQVKAGLTNGLPIKFIEVSMLPNGKVYGNTSLTDYETVRQDFNHDTATNFQGYGAYGYVNFNADSRLNNVLDASFFAADMQHPSYAGHTAMMQEIKPYVVAAQAGQFLAPRADLGAIGSGSGTGSAPSNLPAAQVAVPVRQQNVSVSNGNVTSLVAAGGGAGTGYNAGATNRYGIGYQPNTQVLGFVAFVLNHADGEWVGGFNTSGQNAGSDYLEISYAFHLSAANGQGIRPFGRGTSAAAGNNIGFVNFIDGDVAMIVREATRVVWYIANKQVFATPNTDTGDWLLDFSLKGQGSTIRNITYGAVNLVDFGADPAVTAVYDRTFAALTPGQLADGWVINGASSAQVFNDGLHLYARYDAEAVGISRPYIYQDGEYVLKVDGSAPKVMMHFHQVGNKFLGFWCQGNGYSHNAGILQGSNVSVFGGVDGTLDASGIGGTHYMSMRMLGTLLELRLWPDGGTRPAAAMYSVTITDADLVGPGFAALSTLDSPTLVLEAHLTDTV